MFSLIAIFLALVTITDDPICTINGVEGRLSRPEGIAFSPKGEKLAIANSTNGTVTFYERISDGSAVYEAGPSYVLENKKSLRYTHGVQFTPCGKYIGVASRNTNSVVLFQVGKNFPYQTLKSNLDYPAELSFSSNLLGVASRKGNDYLTFYKQLKSGKFAPKPEWIVGRKFHEDLNLSAPHALAFSPDGKTLATVHKRYVSSPEGRAALVIWDVLKKSPKFIHPLGEEFFHSIAFHPSGNYIAVTNERKNVEIFKREEGYTFSLFAEIPVEREDRKESCKGIAFSACGNYLGFTSTKPAVLIYDIGEFLNHE